MPGFELLGTPDYVLLDYVRNKLYGGVNREAPAPSSLATQASESLITPPDVGPPGLVNMVLGKVEEPKYVGDHCAVEEARAEDGTQASGADELHIVFGKDKSRGSKVKASKPEPMLKSENWKIMPQWNLLKDKRDEYGMQGKSVSGKADLGPRRFKQADGTQRMVQRRIWSRKRWDDRSSHSEIPQ